MHSSVCALCTVARPSVPNISACCQVSQAPVVQGPGGRTVDAANTCTPALYSVRCQGGKLLNSTLLCALFKVQVEPRW